MENFTCLPHIGQQAFLQAVHSLLHGWICDKKGFRKLQACLGICNRLMDLVIQSVPVYGLSGSVQAF